MLNLDSGGYSGYLFGVLSQKIKPLFIGAIRIRRTKVQVAMLLEQKNRHNTGVNCYARHRI